MRLIHRRDFVASMGLGAGAWLLTPILGQLIRPVVAQGLERNKRLILVVDNGGLHEEQRPKVGSGGMGFTLGSYDALIPYKQDLTILEGLHCPFATHLHGNHYQLTGTDPRRIDSGEFVSSFSPSAQTIDRAIAAHIGEGTPIPSLNVHAWNADGSDPAVSFSADGPDAPFPFETDPIAVFGRIFGQGDVASDTEAEERQAMLLRQKRSLLDFVQGDVQRANSRLAGEERAKLDQYLTSLREVEQGLEGLDEVRARCGDPTAPTAEQVGTLDKNDSPDRVRAHFDVIRQAMACGFTRVALVAHQTSRGLSFLPSFVDGDREYAPGNHQMWHGKGTKEQRDPYYQYSASNLAYLWQSLIDTPDGDVSLADNTLIGFMNKNGGRHHNGFFDYQVMMIGNAGGAFETGRFIEMPESPIEEGDPRMELFSGSQAPPKVGHIEPVHFIGDWYTSLAQAVGAPIERFGDERVARGPLPQL